MAKIFIFNIFTRDNGDRAMAKMFIYTPINPVYVPREVGDIGLFITLIPKVC